MITSTADRCDTLGAGLGHLEPALDVDEYLKALVGFLARHPEGGLEFDHLGLGSPGITLGLVEVTLGHAKGDY